MKSIIGILTIIILSVLLISCSDDNVVTSSSNTSFDKLSGKIEQWTYGDSLKLKAVLLVPLIYSEYILDTCSIKSDGSFSINLKTPPDSVLKIMSFTWDTACHGNVVINPSNLKTSSNLILKVYIQYSDTLEIGNIYRYNERDTIMWTKPGDFEVSYIYANNNGSITGTEICVGAWFYPDTMIFDMHGAKGWNKIVYNYLSYSSISTKILLNTIEPGGGKWWFRSYWSGNKSIHNRQWLTESIK